MRGAVRGGRCPQWARDQLDQAWADEVCVDRLRDRWPTVEAGEGALRHTLGADRVTPGTVSKGCGPLRQQLPGPPLVGRTATPALLEDLMGMEGQVLIQVLKGFGPGLGTADLEACWDLLHDA